MCTGCWSFSGLPTRVCSTPSRSCWWPVAGGRGHKDIDKDVGEAIDTLVRWKAMRAEDEAKLPPIDHA